MNWFGVTQFELSQTKCWQIGERFIALKRLEREWTLWNQETSTETNDPIVLVEEALPEPEDLVAPSRFMVSETSDTIHVEPSLADRAVVAKPSSPLVVLPKQRIDVYVSTPLWLSLFVGNSNQLIADIPLWRPSDSWFGPSTMEGDLCYAKYTDAKTDLSLLTKYSGRAITEVSLHNEQSTPLVVEKLNIPTPALKLYINQQGEAWTQKVAIVQSEERGRPVSHVSKSQPTHILDSDHQFESREMSVKPSFLSSIRSLVG